MLTARRKSEALPLALAALRVNGPKMSDPRLDRRDRVGLEGELGLKRVALGGKRDILTFVIQTEIDTVEEQNEFLEFWWSKGQPLDSKRRAEV